MARHTISSTSAASSSTRALRESRSSSRFASSTDGSPPFANRVCSSTSAARIPSTSSGGDDDAGAGLADELRGRAVRRHDRQDRAPGGDVLVDLPGEDALAAAARVGDEEQQRLRVALQPERLARAARTARARGGRRGRASPPTRGPSSGSRRRSARPRPGPRRGTPRRNGRGSRLPKKLPGVRDPEPRPGHVLEPGEVVEVAAVRDHAHGAARAEAAHLVRDRLRDARDGVGAARDELRDLLVRRLPRARRGRVVTPVLVGDERIAQVGDPARARVAVCTAAPTKCTDGGRRGRDHGVDPLAPRDADRGRDRGEVPGDARVGERAGVAQ